MSLNEVFSLIVFRCLSYFASACAFALSTTATAAPGELDTTFVPGDDTFFSSVLGTASQPDGKILVQGVFTNAGGNANIDKSARLDQNGTLDTDFDHGANIFTGTDGIYAAAVQPDGKIVVAGFFSNADGNADLDSIVRFDANGILDPTFAVGDGNLGSGIYSIAILPDGKFLVAGSFTNAGGNAGIDRVARLNANGTVDPTFVPGDETLNGTVRSIALQPDGKVVVGGNFTDAGGNFDIDRVARLNANGTLDTSFKPGHNTFTSEVFVVALQPDGKVVVAGTFDDAGGIAGIDRIARLSSTGFLEASFAPGDGTFGGSIGSALVQADGKIVVVGNFTDAGGNSGIDHLARLASDGSLDTGFVPGDGTLQPVGGDILGSLQADGKVIVGSSDTDIGGNADIDRIARFENSAATGSLTVPNLTTIKWMRGGSAPEAYRVTFESTTNGGLSWKFLGAGSRISGGWQVTGVSFPGNALVRARAYVHGGYFNGSSSLFEATATAPGSTAIPDTWSAWYSYANTYYNYYAALGIYDYAFAFYYYYVGIGDYYFYSANGNAPLANYQYYLGLAYYSYYAYSSFGGGTANYNFYLNFAYAYYFYYLGVGDSNSASYFFNYYYSVALSFL